MSRLVFGGLLAFALLGLFVYAVVLVGPFGQTGDSISFLLQTLGALVSAVVISELSITPPMSEPGTRLAAQSDRPRLVKALVAFYLLVWLISGLFLVVSWVSGATTSQIVTGAAREWLGTGIAAAYAYFGISPQ
jgi:hypothetical protein